MILTIPLEFIQQLNDATTLDTTLNCIARWLPKMVPAIRASITLVTSDNQNLKVYSFSGNAAIPQNFYLPINNSFAGDVFTQQKAGMLNTHDDLNKVDCQILAEHKILSCLDAPLIKAGHCFGTLNLGHNQANAFTQAHLEYLVNLSNLLASHLFTFHQLKIQQRLANTDELTGLANRRFFNETANELIQKSRQQFSSFYLILLDIDYFKKINDSLGHDVGDQVLIEFSNNLKKQMPQNARYARVGGEEFAILLINADQQAATNLAQTIQATSKPLCIEILRPNIELTVSMGISDLRTDDTSIEQVFARADKALYQTKHNGRNQFKFYQAD